MLKKPYYFAFLASLPTDYRLTQEKITIIMQMTTLLHLK